MVGIVSKMKWFDVIHSYQHVLDREIATARLLHVGALSPEMLCVYCLASLN